MRQKVVGLILTVEMQLVWNWWQQDANDLEAF